MIDEKSLAEWKNFAPWPTEAFIEQDLVISRALVDIYNHDLLAEKLVFRGGTALQKLFYQQNPLRHSEDLDFVQLESGPIGSTFDALREVLGPWLGAPKKKFSEGRVTLIYRFQSTGAMPSKLRLKVEINTREHFHKLKLQEIPFKVDSLWFKGEAKVKTYSINELIGSKLRALYQRKKGRDLFDVAKAVELLSVDIDQILECFFTYLDFEGLKITRAEFEKNLMQKQGMPLFRNDLLPLLAHNQGFDFDHDFNLVMSKIITRLPGEPWKGEDSNKSDER